MSGDRSHFEELVATRAELATLRTDNIELIASRGY